MEEIIFFVKRNGKPFRHICQAPVHFKASTILYHFMSLHASMEQEFPEGTALREGKLFTLKSQAADTLCSKNLPSSQISQHLHHINWLGTLPKAKKPYDEGEFVKKCRSDAVDVLSPENSKLK